MIPDRVKCDITDVEHLIVAPNQHVSELVEWSKKKVEELNSGKKICISIDCEGFNLGILPNSLGLVQFAECYDEHIFDPNVEKPISLNIKPGFMVLYPTSQTVTDALSAVFSHPNVRLIAFDFTGDFCTMMEAGIKLNVLDTLDCQFYKWNGPNAPIMNLKKTCMEGDLCAEYTKCIPAIEYKNTISFNKLTYEAREDPQPFLRFLNKEFWDYSSHDIALTALAGIVCVTKSDIKTIYELSRKKAEQLLDDQKKYGVMAPSLAHQISFMIRFLSKIYRSYNIKFAFSNFSKAYCIYNSWDLIDPMTKKAMKKDKRFFEKAMRNAEDYIKTHPNESL